MTLNIITRTCPFISRKEELNRNIFSVHNQTYKSIRHLIIFDGSKDHWRTYNYINFKDIYRNIEYFEADRTNNIGQGKCFFNLYFNDIRKELKEGFILYLDDDDYLSNNKIVEELMNEVDSEDKIYLFKMQWANGRILPDDLHFKKDPERGEIGGSCFIVPVKYMYEFEWDADRASDYRVLLQLFKLFPVERRTWIDKIVVQVGNTGRIK